MSERKPQHDPQAERAVLGAAMLDGECALTVRELLRSADFYDPRNGLVFSAIDTLGKAGIAIDMLLVRSQLHTSGLLEQAGGEEYLVTLTDHIATSQNTAHLCRKVQQLSSVRRVHIAARRIADEATQPIEDIDDYLERASTVLASVCQQRGGALTVRSLADAMDRSFTKLGERMQAGQSLLGHASGFVDLDEGICGFAPGDLIVLAARPGMGKTALANEIKLGIARSTKRPVLSLELEMTEEQLTHRVFATQSGVELARIRAAALTKQDMSDIAQGADGIAHLPVHFIEARGAKISELRKAARAHAANVGQLSLIAVDYLQIAKAERREEQREREVSEISAALKSLAGEMRCPVLALSQLNRKLDSRTDKRPLLSDLRDSGAIEQDADTVLFLYRDEMYHPNTREPGIAEVIIAKQRSGSTGTVRLRWVKDLTRFENLFPQEQHAPQGELEYGSSRSSNGKPPNGHHQHEG